ncbi:MAG TPA: glutamate--tRNA ligase, partial [Candidatus Omnitrophica bacterium]|nr:glutamate--tRNA ligase [Candidatus Omnitrophota bacterium]
LKEKRERMKKKGEVPRYDGKCRNLNENERKRLERVGRKPVIRFKWEKPVDSVTDLIHGQISFKEHQFDDFIIVKTDGRPTYNFSCVIDDHLMGITHVIRGDDHITNTPRQIALYGALELPLPQFAHIPLILGPDKARLSKRHGAVDLLQYKREGYLPEALINFLALLGWSPGRNQELFARDELIQLFSLDRITRRNAIFNKEKLEWMNGQYIKKLPGEKFISLVEPYLRDAGYIKETVDRKWFAKVAELYRLRVRRLSQIVDKADFLFLEEFHYDEEAVNKFLMREYVSSFLDHVERTLERIAPFTPEAIERDLRALAEKLNIGGGDFIHPLRVAITGKSESPPLFDVISLLGKEKTLKRIKKAKRYFLKESVHPDEGKAI